MIITKEKRKSIHPNYWLIIISALTAFFISNVDVGSVAAEITPFVVREFNPNTAQVALLGSISTMAMASIMIASGSLGHIFGLKKILISGAILAVLADVAAYFFSFNFEILIFFRALVGIGAGLSNPLIPAVIMLSAPEKEMPKAYGVFMVSASITSAIRSPLIQLINTQFGWRSVFLLVAGLNMLSLLMISLFVPKLKNSDSKPFDIPGALLAGCGFIAIILGTSFASSLSFTHPLSYGSLVSGIFLLLFLVKYSIKKENPAVEIKLFKNSVFKFSMILGHLLYFSLGLNYFLTVYGITAGGINPLKMSTYGVTIASSQILAGLLAGKLAKIIRPNIIISVSVMMVSIGLILLSTQYKPEMDWGGIYLAAVIMGFGFSTANSRRMSIALTTVPDNIASSGSSINQAFSWSGISLAIAITSAIYPLISSRVFAKLTSSSGISSQPIKNWNIFPSNPAIINNWAIAWGKGIQAVLVSLAIILIVFAINSFFLYQKNNI